MNIKYLICLTLSVILSFQKCTSQEDNTSAIAVAPEGEIKLTTGAYNSWYPCLAWSGGDFGVAWQESRTGDMEVYFERFDDQGTITGTVYGTQQPGDSQDPSLVWDGNYYAMAWSDAVWSEAVSSEYQIYLAIFASETRLTQITNDGVNAVEPSLVWADDLYGIAWQDERDGNLEIYFALVDSDGSKIGSDIRITNDVNESKYPSLVWTGNDFGLAWQDNRNGNFGIFFIVIDATGNKIGSEKQITTGSNSSEMPCLAWNSVEYGMLWAANQNDFFRFFFTRIDENGDKIGSDIQITNENSYSNWSSVVWAGDCWTPVWQGYDSGYDRIFFTELGPDGNRNKDIYRLVNGNSHAKWPSLVWTGSRCAVAWKDFRNNMEEIYFAFLNDI